MLQKLKKGHWPIFLLSSISSLGNLFLPLILVRFLTPTDVGFYKIFFLHLTAIPYLFMVGGPMHSVYYWAAREENIREKYLNASWLLTISLSCLVLIFGFPFQAMIAAQLDLPTKYVTILIITGALFCPTGHYSESSIALGKNSGAIFGTVSELLKAAGFILISWKYKDLYFLLLFYAIFMMTKIAIVTYFNKHYNNISYQTNKSHLKEVWAYCLPMSISGLLGFVIDKVDMLLLSTHLNAASFAFYSLGCLIIPPLYVLEMSIQKILIPEMTKNHLNQDWAAGSAAFRKAIKNISFLIIPSVFGLIIFASPIVKLLYTDQYIDSVIYMRIFAFSYLLLILPHDSVARATGKTSWILKMYVLIMPISLIAAYLAAKYKGAQSVLIVSLIIKFIPKYLGLKHSKYLMNWNWNEMFPIKHLILFTSVCLGLSFLSLMAKDFFQNELHWFFICGGMFAGLYLTFINYLEARGNYVTP